MKDMGRLVGKEMEKFGVTLWLAPGMNIHRNPLCGRNFEYYSEDPLGAGLTAAAMTLGVQETPGVDMSSGSLGQGISAAVGMALAAKLDNASYRTYTLLGDGEIQEGQVWEAAMFAGAKKLDNLVVIVDNNNLQIDGTLEEVNSPYPIDEKFKAFGFNVINIDGHDFDQIDDAFTQAENCKGKPTVIIAKTIKGKGVSFMENQVSWHGAAPNEEQYKQGMAELQAAVAALDK